jgi:hypothetical protein
MAGNSFFARISYPMLAAALGWLVPSHAARARRRGRPLRRRLTADGSAFAFCPREGGSEELSGVFGKFRFLRCPDIAARQGTAEVHHQTSWNALAPVSAAVRSTRSSTGPISTMSRRSYGHCKQTAAEKNCPANTTKPGMGPIY